MKATLPRLPDEVRAHVERELYTYPQTKPAIEPLRRQNIEAAIAATRSTSPCAGAAPSTGWPPPTAIMTQMWHAPARAGCCRAMAPSCQEGPLRRLGHSAGVSLCPPSASRPQPPRDPAEGGAGEPEYHGAQDRGHHVGDGEAECHADERADRPAPPSPRHGGERSAAVVGAE